MKKSFTFLALTLFSFFILSHAIEKDVWTNYYNDDQVQISFKDIQCKDVQNGTDNNYVLLQLENKTNLKLKVSFKKTVWYDGKCQNCKNTNEEQLTTITLEPFEKMEGSCKSNKSLRIFSHMNNQLTNTKLTKFDLDNILITQQ